MSASDLLNDASRMLAIRWPDSSSITVVAHLLPDFVELLDQSKDVPLDALRGTIRTMLAEQHAISESAAPASASSLDARVEAVLELLDEVRSHAVAEGRWHDAPVTPLMCG